MKIKLTENRLKQIISKSINKVLNESANREETLNIYNFLSNFTYDLGTRITEIRNNVINGQEITKDEINSVYEDVWEIHDYVHSLFANETLADELY